MDERIRRLQYESRTDRPKSGWVTKLIKIFAVLFGVAAAILGGFWFVVWMIYHQMDRVTLTVNNQTSQIINSAVITDGNGVPILTLGPILPGSQSTATVHFGNDEGGKSDLIVRCGSRKSSQAVWMLINTHGPYEYTAKISDAGVHLEYDVASKGSGTDDFASPTTVPSQTSRNR